jgi:ABC-2 type transport system permease protein
MTFRANFLIDTISSIAWMLMNLGLYMLIFRYTPMLGAGTGWGKYEFYLFLATTLLVNSTVQTFFMANADEFSELIRTGSLDFALLKPIDTQFLVSLQRIEWSSMGNFCFGLVLAVYALIELHYLPGIVQGLLYLGYVAAGVIILYSLMISLAASSVWLGRNQTLYDFWFYITNFARYPREIYRGPVGDPLRWFFTFFIPVLVVINVPARVLVPAKQPQTPEDWCLPLFALAAAAGSFLSSRWVFRRALSSYRSASS